MGRPIVIAAGCILFLGARALADGGYWPEKAIQARPAMPQQRALIVYRNGVQTLVVESGFDTQSSSVGWVLPLPAEPTKLAVGDPGMLTSLAVCIQPQIIHDLRPEFTLTLICLSLAVPLGVILVVPKTWETKRKWLWNFLLLVVLGSLFASCLLPSLGSAGGGGTLQATSVSVSPAQRVGNYEVQVLRAGDAGGLSDWLSANGFAALDGPGRAAVQDYIARQWCFVVAKLVRESGGPATPHPIRVDFPAAAPVYPMKLTGLAGSNTQVDLFVVADGRADARGFQTVACDQFKPVPSQDDERWGPRPYVEGPAFRSETIGLGIGQPGVMELMWDGCVLTRLTRTFSPVEMSQDIVLNIGPAKPYQQTLFSPLGRRYLAAFVLTLGGALLAIFSASLIRRRPAFIHRPWTVFGSAAMLLAMTTGTVYLVAPMTSGTLTTMRSHGRVDYNNRALRDTVYVYLLNEETHIALSMTDAQIGAEIEEALKNARENRSPLLNLFTGQPPRFESSPGNFWIRRDKGDVFLCTYDWIAREKREPLLSATTQPASE